MQYINKISLCKKTKDYLQAVQSITIIGKIEIE